MLRYCQPLVHHVLRTAPLTPLAALRPLSTSQSTASAPIPIQLGYLHYSYVDNMLEKRQPHREAHLAYAGEKNRQGDVIMGGALNNPVDAGIIICRNVSAAEAFAANDPYVLNGLVAEYHVREYNVVVGSFFDSEKMQKDD